MPDIEAYERVYQAFLRGYREFGASSGAPIYPYASLIQAASLESKELRRSVDACRAALEQLTSLPATEQDQLKVEARASLEALQTAADRLLARLRTLRPTEGDAASSVDDQTLTDRPHKTRRRR